MTTPGDDDLLGSTNPDEAALGIESGPFDLAAAVETPAFPHPNHHDDGDAGLAELRRTGDPRVTEETKAAVRALTQADWDQHANAVDELTKHDFDDVDADI